MTQSVRIFIGAEAAYACIKAPTYTLDVRLNPSMGAPASLRQSATELRAKAACEILRAERMESAAAALESEVAQ